MRIPLAKTDIGEREIAAVARCLASGQLSLGPLMEEFETRFAAYVGSRFAIATSSGTAALHLCVKALGIGASDDVITTSFSFVASTNCVLYENARPIFADIDPETLNIDPARIRELIERNYSRDLQSNRWINRRSRRVLKALLPVHVFGLPCSMEQIVEIAREFGLAVIEDACEALGAEYLGRRAGTFGDAAAFAFYPNKQITTAEGGMIVTDDAAIASLCRKLRNQGRGDNSRWLCHEHLGFNYRLSELHCALGIAQLERVGELLARRAYAADLYSQNLSGIRGISVPQDSPGSKRSWFTYVIQLKGPSPAPRRDIVIEKLRGRGIDCRPYFPAIHHQPYLGDFGLPLNPLPNTESASARCLALPLFPSIGAAQVREVCSAIREILDEIDSEGARESHAREEQVAR